MTYYSKMTMKEYYEKYPELSEVTKFILWSHKPVLDTIKKQEKSIKEKYKKQELERESWQERIDIASTPYRKTIYNNEVRVLEGISLDKAPEPGRIAYNIQANNRTDYLCYTEDFGYGEEFEEQANKVEKLCEYVDNLPKRLGAFSIDECNNSKEHKNIWDRKLEYDKIKLYYKRSINE